MHVYVVRQRQTKRADWAGSRTTRHKSETERELYLRSYKGAKLNVHLYKSCDGGQHGRHDDERMVSKYNTKEEKVSLNENG